MNLTDPIFTNKDAAREYLEGARWGSGVFCPHCGGVDRVKKLQGKSHRPGLFQCGDCRKQFTVTVGTVFERSKVPLNKWLLATFMMASSKKGMSAHQLHRSIGVTYKTAWFMFHRIREAMRNGDLSPLGGGGGPVEADETYVGREPGKKLRRAGHHKMKVLSRVDRETGVVRSFVVDKVDSGTVIPIVHQNVAREARMMTDEANIYGSLGMKYASHETVNHSKDEYVRGEAHTNTLEGYFSIFKRGMKGVYQHCGKHHLHRYVAEFDFRYSTRAKLDIDDTQRARLILQGISGKRLTYRRPDARASA